METDGINNNTDFTKVKMMILKQIAIHLFTVTSSKIAYIY